MCVWHISHLTDASAAKLRPVLVVSGDKFNNGADIVVLPISSRPEQNDPYAVYIGQPEYQQAGLRRDSSVKWAKPATIAKSVVRRRLGTMPQALLDETCEQLVGLFKN